MKKVFIDSDVFLDVILDRNEFADASSKIFDLGILNILELYTSAICISNIYYLSNRLIGKKKAIQLIKDIKPIFEVCPTSDFAIEKALVSTFNDLEDAFQHFTAVENKLDLIITRNTKDFRSSEIPVFSPKEFLATL